MQANYRTLGGEMFFYRRRCGVRDSIFLPSKEAGQNVDHKTGDMKNLIRLKRIKNKKQTGAATASNRQFFYCLCLRCIFFNKSFIFHRATKILLCLLVIVFVNAPALSYAQLK
jgi:hypothetical protein